MQSLRVFMRPMTQFLCCHPDSIARSADLAVPVKDFKIRLVSAFCENHKNAQVIDAAALRAIAASQRGLDVVYPAIGDNFDFLRRLRDESVVLLHFLKRPEDVFCWQFAKKGFFNFKKHIPDMISFAQSLFGEALYQTNTPDVILPK